MNCTKPRSAPQLKQDHQGKIVAIDIETGAFEIANDSLTAAKQLLQHLPDVQIFGIRIGEQAVHRYRSLLTDRLASKINDSCSEGLSFLMMQ